MGVEIANCGTLWICYGPMPALTRLPEGTLVPVEPVHVTTVIPEGDQGINMDIHNSFPDGRVLLGVIGGYPIKPTRETASRILNMRAAHKKPVVGHFPGPEKNADKVVKNRFIDSSLAHMMYRNTLSPETVPPIMSHKDFKIALASVRAQLGPNAQLYINATEGTLRHHLREEAKAMKGITTIEEIRGQKKTGRKSHSPLLRGTLIVY